MSFQWNDKQPITKQLVCQVCNMILVGDLKENELLPPVRQIATEYKLNPITVSNAWNDLIEAGVVENKQALGLVIKGNAKEIILKSEQKLFMTVEWPQVKTRIRNLKLEIRELCKSL